MPQRWAADRAGRWPTEAGIPQGEISYLFCLVCYLILSPYRVYTSSILREQACAATLSIYSLYPLFPITVAFEEPFKKRNVLFGRWTGDTKIACACADRTEGGHQWWSKCFSQVASPKDILSPCLEAFDTYYTRSTTSDRSTIWGPRIEAPMASIIMVPRT